MNTTQPTIQSVKVNDGDVRRKELPIWVGKAMVTSPAGNVLTMSVTKDREWMWARFSGTLSEKSHSKLIEKGWVHSIRRNGYHAEFNEVNCKFLQSLGALSINYTALTTTFPKANTMTGLEPIELDADGKPKGKFSTGPVNLPPADGKLYRNQAGRVVDSNGRFVKVADLAPKLTPIEVLPTTTTVEKEVNVNAFEQGKAVGTADRIRGMDSNMHNDMQGDSKFQYELGYQEGFKPPMSEKDIKLAELQAQLAALMAAVAELSK